jgi:hypothetical protein
LGCRIGRIKFSNQFREAVWYSLPYDIVVHGSKLVPDSRLNLSVEAALLARRGIFALWIFHDLFHASPRVKPLIIQQFSFIFEAFAATLMGANSNSAGKFRDAGTFIGLGRNQARQGDRVHPAEMFFDPRL